MLPGKACGMISQEVVSVVEKYVPTECNSTQRALVGVSRKLTGQWLVENERMGIYSRVGSAVVLSERMHTCLFIPSLRLSLSAGLLSLNSFQECVIWRPVGPSL